MQGKGERHRGRDAPKVTGPPGRAALSPEVAGETELPWLRRAASRDQIGPGSPQPRAALARDRARSCGGARPGRRRGGAEQPTPPALPPEAVRCRCRAALRPTRLQPRAGPRSRRGRSSAKAPDPRLQPRTLLGFSPAPGPGPAPARSGRPLTAAARSAPRSPLPGGRQSPAFRGGWCRGGCVGTFLAVLGSRALQGEGCWSERDKDDFQAGVGGPVLFLKSV